MTGAVLTGAIVRRAERRDAGALFAMLRELARFHGREPTIGRDAFECHGWDAPARFDAWIAETPDGSPLGFAQGFGKYSSWSGGEVFFLANLWVDLDALASVLDANGAAYTLIRRFLPPWLISGAPCDPPDLMDDSGAVGIMGTICAVLRTGARGSTRP